MEELLVYKATLILGGHALKIGEGWRSSVYALSETTCVKVTTTTRARKEAQLLKTVNEHGIGPKLLQVDGEKLYLERVYGEPFSTVFPNAARAVQKKLAAQLLDQARTLDLLQLNKMELTRPGANVLITKTNAVVLLDFERAIYTQRPANVTQVAAYLSRAMHSDAAWAKEEAKLYRKELSEKSYKKLRSRFV